MPRKADRRMPLLALLLAAPLLAGCAEPPLPEPPAPPEDPVEDRSDDGTPADMLSAEGGKRLYEEAVFDVPPRIGLDMTATRDGQPLLALRGHQDDIAGTAWFRIEAEPALLAQAPGDLPESVMQGFQEGAEVYVSPEGSLYLGGGMAIVYPPGAKGGLLPLPQESPFMELFESFRPGAREEAPRNTTVDRVAPVMHKGRSAIQLDMRETTENGTSTGRIVLYTNPPRIAHARMHLVDGEEPFRGADVTMELLYDDEIPSEPPMPVARALGLAYESKSSVTGSARDPGGRRSVTTWTFVRDGGIPLDEVEVVVKEQSADVARLDQMQTRWAMPLSEGARSAEGIEVAFTDADGDGLVGRGDTLRFTAPEGEKVFLALRDVKTGVYVVPGPAHLLALGLAGLAALALRRRA